MTHVIKLHVIEIVDVDDDRAYWECTCGSGGSAPTEQLGLAAEKHVEPGESVMYRYPSRRQ